jgi:hypothetical protein
MGPTLNKKVPGGRPVKGENWPGTGQVTRQRATVGVLPVFIGQLCLLTLQPSRGEPCGYVQ